MISTIQLRVFGSLTDILGNDPSVMEPVADLESLKEILMQKYPALKNAPFRIAVNEELVIGNKELQPGDVVALLPPFSGG